MTNPQSFEALETMISQDAAEVSHILNRMLATWDQMRAFDLENEDSLNEMYALTKEAAQGYAELASLIAKAD